MVVLLDVSAEQHLAAERDRLFEAEKAAHAAAAAARDRAVAVSRAETAARLRLQALQAVTAGLATAVTSEQIADVLTGRGMSMVADHGVIALLDPERAYLLTRATSDFPVPIARAYSRIPVAQADETPVGQTALSGRPIMMTSVEEIAARCPLVASSHALTGTSSLLAVPVRAGDRSIGALGFGFRATGPVNADIVAVAETLAELTGQALERARLYEAEHAAAHQLQQALLPPTSCSRRCCRRFRPNCPEPGSGSATVRPSAAAMWAGTGTTRSSCPGGGSDLRSATSWATTWRPRSPWGACSSCYVASGGARPAEVLQSLDDACPAVTGTDFATVGYAEYDPAEAVVTYACAGHPPPLLVADGQAHYLNDGRSAPLGFKDGLRPEARLTVPPGAMLVWYSDGLIERRGEVIDQGLDRLAALAAGLEGADAQHWCDSLLADMTDGQIISDDVVVACLQLRGEPTGAFRS